MVPLLFFLFLFSWFPPGKPDLESDKAALLAFRDAVGRSVLQWNASSSSPCSWQGVTCQAGNVSILRLPGVGLYGRIPDGALGNLTGLRTLSLRFNGLSGRLPADLAALGELRNLYLHNNRFSGEIPSSILSLRNLVRLNLAQNAFAGSIPAGIGNLKRLRTLFLEGNQLTGQIPDFNLTLDQFNVSFNRLNGSIPRSLRTMPGSAFFGLDVCGLPSSPCPDEVPSPAPSPVEPTPPDDGGNRKKKKLSGGAIAGIAIGSVVGFLVLSLLLFFLFCGGRRENRTRSVEVAASPHSPGAEASTRTKGDAPGGGGAAAAAASAAVASAAVVAARGESNSGASKNLVFFGSDARVFDVEELLRASAEVLGKGTFGTAYKAVLESERVLAVKRLRDVELPEQEFRAKIEPVGAMVHGNLVPLRAYYYSKDEKLLVYDFISEGSLSSLLHGTKGTGRPPLHWRTRVEIALDAARGVAYIHSTSPSASHGNLKSSNVLLLSGTALVSDHGLAPLASAVASPFSGRLSGYRAPEVTDSHRISQKADVYSFGVLLLELLTGKAPAQALLNEEAVDLPRWVQSVVKEEWASEVFDPELLRYQDVEDEMVQLLQLAIDCTAQYPDKRPAMPEIVSRIEQIHRSSSRSDDQQKV
ncbi:unnamed protein product [Spirodela intermedia]|uniref:Protein kinase domain-containing protein n=1 Tax=Spirodela intermedia TaxID=51605 RepID=A0A7I8KAY0_SPIIN|nr:unnamed protein product [Spirodela intermedia]